ncbi:MAG TPA: hypothetical protein VJS47_11580 [Rhizomicrobium sp.]|nr:hypothetical protein [Rhizomicrobium sp.]
MTDVVRSETCPDEGMRGRLLGTAQAFVLNGNQDFSLASLCREAGVDGSVFRNHFSSKAELMGALMRDQAQHQVQPKAVAQTIPEPPRPITVLEPGSASKAELEPSVFTPDAWLERRLRVFERTLNALEAKAETTAREQARVIAQLEERLAAQGTASEGLPAVAQAAMVAPQPAPLLPPTLPAEPSAAPVLAPNAMHQPDAAPEAPAEVSAAVSVNLLVEEPPLASEPPGPQPFREAWQQELPLMPLAQDTKAPAAPPDEGPAGQILISEGKTCDDTLSGDRPVPENKTQAETPSLLRNTYDGAFTTVEPQTRLNNAGRVRWLAGGALSLVILFLCLGLFLDRRSGPTAIARQIDGVARRQAADTIMSRTKALADAGNPRAQARLALAYLRGQGSAGDANAAYLWSLSAAREGNPVAQYLLGVQYLHGDRVKADPAAAVQWFQRAADKGNLKAMHNLAIAYANGQGVEKDEAKAVEWFARAAKHGYVDSVFNLAVMYERGAGVPQDPLQAFKWYSIAAMAGDASAKERLATLRGEMTADEIKLASNAAQAFEPAPAAEDANTL